MALVAWPISMKLSTKSWITITTSPSWWEKENYYSYALHKTISFDVKKCEYFQPIGFCKNYMYKTNSNSNYCRLTMSQEAMAFRQYFMGVPKKSPFVEELNKAYIPSKNISKYMTYQLIYTFLYDLFLIRSYWWHEFGLKKYWDRQRIKASQQCLLKYNDQGEAVQLAILWLHSNYNSSTSHLPFYSSATCWLSFSSYENVLFVINSG